MVKSDVTGSDPSTANLSTYEFNNFTGHTTDWDSSDTTEYSAEFVVDGGNAGGGISAYVTETMPLNSTARTDIQNNSQFQFCILEFDEHYSNNYDSSYGESTVHNGPRENRLVRMFHVDHSTTSNRPFLEYEAEGGAGYGHAVLGVAAGNIAKVNTVATANIAKVNTVD